MFDHLFKNLRHFCRSHCGLLSHCVCVFRNYFLTFSIKCSQTSRWRTADDWELTLRSKNWSKKPYSQTNLRSEI
jgi:hypothetical protein